MTEYVDFALSDLVLKFMCLCLKVWKRSMKMCIMGHFQQKYGIKIQSINSHKGFSIMSELSSA